MKKLLMVFVLVIASAGFLKAGESKLQVEVTQVNQGVFCPLNTSIPDSSKSKKKPSNNETYEIIYVTRSNVQDVMNSPRPVIIDVYTDWCPPCKALAPIFKKLNDEYGDRYQFAKLNGDEEPGLLDHFRIQGVPTLLFIKNSNESGRIVGFTGEDKIVKKMKEYFEEQ